MTIYCGIDWAEAHHDLAIIEQHGGVLAQRRVSDDLAGFNELLRLLAEHGDTAGNQIPVAIETGRGLFVACLIATGRDVVVINRWLPRGIANAPRSPGPSPTPLTR